MKRIVYSPKVSVFVKADSGIYDLTDHVIDCTITRKINQVSSATVTFRNPDRMFTNGENGPVFHPMDPIVIFMTRVKDRPVQVFTGYCDTTPYLQLKPAPATIQASCTLKKLLYTYWDPGLPFVQKVLEQRGWSYTTEGGVNLANFGASTQNLNDNGGNNNNGNNGNNGNLQNVTDGSIGALLYDVLFYIGNWDPSTIFIENIPKGVYESAESLLGDINQANEESQKELKELFKYIIGQNSLGGGSPSSTNDQARAGEWVRIGATIDPTAGQPQYDRGYNGMSYAELLVAGANAGLKDQSLGSILGLNSPDWVGMPMNTPLKIRMPGQGEGYTIYKIDNGSGQTGDPHFKIDLHQGIADRLGWTPNQDVEIARVVSSGNSSPSAASPSNAPEGSRAWSQSRRNN